MKLKTATMLAIIGTSIIVCLQIFFLYSNIMLIGNDYDWIVRNIVTGSLKIISFSMLLVFFVTLYKNQKK